MLADRVLYSEQRQRLFVGLTQFRAVFNRIQMADRREDASQHIVHFRQRLARFSQLYGAPCATALHRGRQSSSALVTAGTTCSGLIAEKAAGRKASIMDWSYALSC